MTDYSMWHWNIEIQNPILPLTNNKIRDKSKSLEVKLFLEIKTIPIRAKLDLMTNLL